MYEANIPRGKRYVIAQMAFETATKLDKLIPVMVNEELKPRVEHWGGEIPRFAQHLRVWGEAGVVKTKTKTTPKLDERGITCMFIGYVANHASNCYKMFNWNTRRIILIRDVHLLKRMYFPTLPVEDQSEANDDDDDDDGMDNDPGPNGDLEPPTLEAPYLTIYDRVVIPPHQAGNQSNNS